MLGLPPFQDLRWATTDTSDRACGANVQQVAKVTSSVYLDLEPTPTRMAPALRMAVNGGLIPGRQMPAAFAFAPSRSNRCVKIGVIVGAKGCTGRDYSERFRQLGQAMDRNKQYWPSNLANVVNAATAQDGGPPNLTALRGMVRVARQAGDWVEFSRRERCAHQPKPDHPLQGRVGQAAMAGGEHTPPEGFPVAAHMLHQRPGAAEEAGIYWNALLSHLEENPPLADPPIELDFTFGSTRPDLPSTSLHLVNRWEGIDFFSTLSAFGTEAVGSRKCTCYAMKCRN